MTTKSNTNPPRLLESYRKDIAPELKKDLNLSNINSVPKISKMVLNIGLGEALTNSKALENSVKDVSLITGQKPITTKAKNSIAQFKIREGMAIGVATTLRGRRMYEFLDRLINLSIPRMRDFRGLSTKSFDGNGNYTIGIKEHVIFPEIDYNSIDKIRSLQIIIVTTAKDNETGLMLLSKFGFPFVKQEGGTINPTGNEE
jgi:large subunit ribosomal protein L5